MSEFSLPQRITHKIEEKSRPLFANSRQKKLNNTDFTIISNNCWGGVLYEYFNIPKQSPTVGTYFFADDYVRFISDLHYYTQVPIEIIGAKHSKHSEALQAKGEGDIPVGKLDDVEIVFLHYKDPELAKDKWTRRVQRINWDNLIVKFSYMNECTDEHVYQFEKLSGVKKFVFVPKQFPFEDAIVIPGNESGQISNDTFYFKKYIDIYELVNSDLHKASELRYDGKCMIEHECLPG